MTYLILTKPECPDAQLWSLNQDSVLLAVDKNGVIYLHTVDTVVTGITNDTRLVVVNMSHPFWSSTRLGFPEQRKPVVQSLQNVLSSTARIWVHFGYLPSDTIKVGDIDINWGKPLYAAFRDAFQKSGRPLSHSRGSIKQMVWDAALINLSQQILTSLTNNLKLDLHGKNGWLSTLDNAWEKALAWECRDASHNQVLDCPVVDAMKNLLAVAIYCDGLIYALEVAPSKVDPMREILAKEVPSIVASTNIVALDKQGQAAINALAASANPADLGDKAKDFMNWYRPAAKSASPSPSV